MGIAALVLALVSLAGGLLIGLAVGAKAVLRSIARERRPLNTDYKERWLGAVNLLAQEGKVTQEQCDRIMASPAPAGKGARPVRQGISAGAGSVSVQAGKDIRMGSPRGMATWDRRYVEIERARAGLPPADDLRGMASWDIRDVLTARARYGTAGKGVQ